MEGGRRKGKRTEMQGHIGPNQLQNMAIAASNTYSRSKRTDECLHPNCCSQCHQQGEGSIVFAVVHEFHVVSGAHRNNRE